MNTRSAIPSRIRIVDAVCFLPLILAFGWAWSRPGWAYMTVISATMYLGFKALTWIRRAPGTAPIWRHFAYWTGWPGMDADAFLFAKPNRCPSAGEGVFAAGKTVLGATLLWFAGTAGPEMPPMATAWLAMAGVVFLLHFGTFHGLSILWRTLGCKATPLMNWPVAARSVSEFWGRRWNTAFRDLANRFIFKPASARWGGKGGILAGFLFSGIIHEAAITLPARGGYGGPTLYFLIQGMGLLLERSPFGRKAGLMHGLRGRVFALAIVLLPTGLLFPVAFRERVILPFLHLIFP